MRPIKSLIPVALLALAATACSKREAATETPPQPAPPPAVSVESAPPELPDTDWRLHGLDVGEQRYSTLDQINRDTVDQLELAFALV